MQFHIHIFSLIYRDKQNTNATYPVGRSWLITSAANFNKSPITNRTLIFLSNYNVSACFLIVWQENQYVTLTTTSYLTNTCLHMFICIRSFWPGRFYRLGYLNKQRPSNNAHLSIDRKTLKSVEFIGALKKRDICKITLCIVNPLSFINKPQFNLYLLYATLLSCICE